MDGRTDTPSYRDVRTLLKMRHYSSSALFKIGNGKNIELFLYMKKSFVLSILSLTQNCGYQPLLSEKYQKFSIDDFNITGDRKYANQIEKLQKTIQNHNIQGNKECSFPLFWNTESGKPVNSHTSLGAFGDSFFEYLIKEWIRSKNEDNRVKDMFYKASPGKRHSLTI